MSILVKDEEEEKKERKTCSPLPASPLYPSTSSRYPLASSLTANVHYYNKNNNYYYYYYSYYYYYYYHYYYNNYY